MSGSISSQGVAILRGDGSGSPENFEKIAEVMSFNGPGTSAPEIDVTSLDSTAKEYRLGLKDHGTFSFESMFIPKDSGQKGLQADLDNRTLRNFRLEFPKQDEASTSGTVFEFAAYVTEFSMTGGVDEVVKASISLRISGDITKTHEA
jgi:hypothetical protein